MADAVQSTMGGILKKYRPMALSAFVAGAFLLSIVPGALAMGPPPGACYSTHSKGVEYESTITSFTVDNGDKTYDVMANPGVVIPVTRDQGFEINFVLHTDKFGFALDDNGSRVYEKDSGIEGLVWYGDTFDGYSNGRCLGPTHGDSDYTGNRHIETKNIPNKYPDNEVVTPYAITSFDSDRPSVGVSIKVVDKLQEDNTTMMLTNDTAGQLPPADNNTTDTSENPTASNNNYGPAGYQSQHHHRAVLDTELATNSGATSSSEQKNPMSRESGDSLVIGGKIASLLAGDTTTTIWHPLILSGNWSMAVSNNNVTSFDANITAIQFGSSDRQLLRISNFTSTDRVYTDNDTLSVTSAVDIAANNNTIIQDTNATITIERLGAIKIVLMQQGVAEGTADMSVEIHGLVNSIVLDGKNLSIPQT